MIQTTSTIREVLEDKYFISRLEKNIEEYIAKRRTREKPKPGYYYKRDWCDKLVEDRNMRMPYFVEHIEDIWIKKSRLSPAVRNGILYMCSISLNETLEYYKNTVLEKNYDNNNTVPISSSNSKI